MPRGYKNKADYFPHEAKHCRLVEIIQAKYGNDGYAVFYKLKELLCEADGHYLDIQDLDTYGYLVSYMGVRGENSEQLINLILLDMVKFGLLDEELFKDKVLWSSHLVNDLKILYENRRRQPPEKPYFENGMIKQKTYENQKKQLTPIL